MKTLLTKLQNKRKEEKGFTLVELLVVIAILAILASVSIVGYVGFTQRAKDSNANTELMQAKTLIIAEVLDGENAKYAYEDDVLYVLDVDSTKVANYENSLKTDFSELGDLKGTFTVKLRTTAYNMDNETDKNDYAVEMITYDNDGGHAEIKFNEPKSVTEPAA